MAKRKRLSPAQPGYLDRDGPAPETKAAFPTYPDGVYRRPAAPIADVAGQAAASAAAAEMAETLHRARTGGRLVMELPLEAIAADYLVRDRIVVDEGEMATLMDSLRQRGQQTPIEVTDLGDGRYGLISGWRRLRALRALAAEGVGPDHVLALLRQPEEASDAYLAMVEENEIRVGLSYYERARIAARAVDQGVFETEKAALLSLFRSASRAKRSKIRSFLSVVRALDGVLRYPEALGERAGLTLAKALEADDALAPRLRTALTEAEGEDGAAEQALIQQLLRPRAMPAAAPAPLGQAEILPGVMLTDKGKDGVLLHGPGVTPSLRLTLEKWLKSLV